MGGFTKYQSLSEFGQNQKKGRTPLIFGVIIL
jgi:hypothetical protein